MRVEPFRIAVPYAVLADLRERLTRTRFPDEIPGSGWGYGTALAYGLTDSPAGLAAWIVEKVRTWSDGGGDVERRFGKGCAIFPREIMRTPRAWAERCYNVTRWTPMSAGGHFAAMEEPAALVEDIRAFFRTVR